MFLFVMGWAQGANVTAKEFIWHNLIPATLGNYIGGGICLATTYAIAFGSAPRVISNLLHGKGPKRS
ncbi:hypothetical protein TSOC_005370 [Tetrabaena socialis]|uniref:Formate transporter n=1 Tax=Tetrabaena socialis TaxID=47790 RepID=A0A2J8A6E3_9CHLO|nr:hypothetical protein TSOC_005370 [Tetrabaena socialis]|eukprot:PNH08102.1 hypothetical protein TSOC_005370 [Tetrabaena socialis]